MAIIGAGVIPGFILALLHTLYIGDIYRGHLALGASLRRHAIAGLDCYHGIPCISHVAAGSNAVI